MGNIVVLDELTTCKIAAGEVIERPASVVKELIENSIDAGAKKIQVEITSGGIRMIKITDDGCGFEADDALIAFDKHATSKIHCADDIDSINTLGFRGEALASIAAVSEVILVSKTANEDTGVTVKIKGGTPEYCKPCGCNKGTCFTIRDLFYNTPARYKFLKRDSTEAGYVADVIEKMAINRPDISFTLINNGKMQISSPGNGDALSAIYSVFGKEVANSLLKISYISPDGRVTISGFVGTGGAVYKTRARQYFFVNGRCVKNKFLSVALDESVKTSVMKGCFPFAVVKINVPVQTLDVNVHPMKTEIRFQDENAIFSHIYTAIKVAFTGGQQEIEEILPRDYLKPEIKTAGKIFEVKDSAPSDGYGDSATVQNEKAEPDAAQKQSVPRQCTYTPANTPTYATANTTPSEKKSIYSEDNKKAISDFLNAIKDQPVAAPRDDRPNTLINMSPLNEEATESADLFENADIVGQVFNTYILLEKDGNLYIIDQHAAHERLMYEDIKNIMETKKYNTQMLLSPIALNLSKSEFSIISDNFEYFENMGFELEAFGSDTILVRAVPSILTDSDISSFVAEGIACITEGTQKKFFSDKAVYTMACKAAVKGNHHLDYIEIEALLKRIASLTGPATCPHGRPFYIKVTRSDLDKKFKRIL